MDTFLYDRIQDTCPDKVKILRNFIRQDVEQRDGCILFPRKYRINTISLPRWNDTPELDDLYRIKYIDRDMQDDLERSGVLNWCRTAEKLFPLKTTADGNCLLHAISQAMWGIEDTELFLRRLLYLNIVTDPTGNFKKRWLFHQRNNSELVRADVRLNTVEVSEEWETVIKATDDLTHSPSDDLPYTALESIHLYVSANMLKRPIIVLADSMARNVFGQTLQDNQIGGIYLPLEWQPDQCNKNPIVIGYNMNHFCPLALKEKQKSNTSEKLLRALPIVTKEMDSIPARFLLPNEEHEFYSIICRYLNMTEVTHNMTPFPAAKLNTVLLENDVNIVEANKNDCLSKWRQFTGMVPKSRPHLQVNVNVSKVSSPKGVRSVPKHNVNQPEEYARNPCQTVGCQSFAHPDTPNYCLACFNEFTVQFADQEAVNRNVAGKRPSHQAQPARQTGEQGQGRYQGTERQQSFHDLSMLGEDCHAGCGFKCSIETFPYCHECYPKYMTAGAVGNTQQAEGQPGLSLMPDKCQNPSCEYQCSKATYPFCHSCYDKITSTTSQRPSAPPSSLPVQPVNQGAAPPRTEPSAPAPSVPFTTTNYRPVDIQAACMPSGANQKQPKTLLNLNRSQLNNIQGYTGALDKKCLTSTCNNPAIRGNDGYCNSCYDQRMYGGPAGTPLLSPMTPNISVQCSSPGCNEPVTPGTNHCFPCFLRGDSTSSQLSLTGQNHQMNIQSPMDILNQFRFRRNMHHSIPTEHDELNPVTNNQAPLATNLQREESLALQRKLLCPKPGCSGLKSDNEEGLCSNCWIEQRGLLGEAVGEGQVNDLENSVPYASCNLPSLSKDEMNKLNPIVKSSKDKVKCASCSTMIYPPRKLCEQCTERQQKMQATQSMELNILSVGGKGERCRTLGCQFFGMPDTNGYCSSCYKSQVRQTRHSIPLVQRSFLSTNTAPLLNNRSMSAPLKGSHCIVPNCQRFGDPKQLNRCSYHYEQEIMRSPAMSPESIQQQSRLITLQNQGINVTCDKYNVAGVHYPNQATHGHGQTVNRTRSDESTRLNDENNSESFDEVYNKLYVGKKTHKHCRNQNRGCINYENPAKDGYCNTCYSHIGNAVPH